MRTELSDDAIVRTLLRWWNGRVGEGTMVVDAVAIDGGTGEWERLAGDSGGALGLTEQSVLAALHARVCPIAPAEIIRELESAGFRNPDIRSAIWHLLDRHRIRLTRDLRLVLPVAAAPSPHATS